MSGMMIPRFAWAKKPDENLTSKKIYPMTLVSVQTEDLTWLGTILDDTGFKINISSKDCLYLKSGQWEMAKHSSGYVE